MARNNNKVSEVSQIDGKYHDIAQLSQVNRVTGIRCYFHRASVFEK